MAGADVRVLGIETATWTASVAIIDGAVTLTEETLPRSASHGTALFSLVDTALTTAGTPLQAVDLIAVSIGPGSFTGLRIGLSVAKGLALARGIPVVGVPTLTALAVAAGPRPHRVWAVLDARKSEVYAAAFDRSTGGGLQAVFPASVCTAEYLTQCVAPPCTLVGDAVDAYGEVFHSRWGNAVELEPAANVAPSGSAVAQLGAALFRTRGADPVATLEPSYVRTAEAERLRPQVFEFPFVSRMGEN